MHRLHAERAKGRVVARARERSNPQTGAVVRRAERPPGVRNVAQAVVPEGKYLVFGARGNLARKPRAKLAVEACARIAPVGERERNVENAQRRHTFGQIARREIAEVDVAGRDEIEKIGNLAAALGDIPLELDADAPGRSFVQGADQHADGPRVYGLLVLISGDADAGHQKSVGIHSFLMPA